MRYKLIASDLDGTLLNSKAELSGRTKEAIIRAVNSGIMFVTVTGRPFCNIRVVNDILDNDMPFIVFNGSAAYMGKSGKCLFEKYMDLDLACEAFEMGNKFGFAQISWTGPGLWANRVCDETLQYRDFSTVSEMGVTSDLRDITDDIPGISKVLWIADPLVIAEKRNEMIKHFDGRLNCYSSMAHFLEFVSIDAGKGTALEEIGRQFDIDRSEMIAFGDAYNDVSMLEYAGYSVAMANSPDDIKTICDHVADTNDNDGVAEVIENIVLSDC